MKWLTENPFAVALAALVGMLVLLTATGHLHWGGDPLNSKRAESKQVGEQEEKKVRAGKVVLDEDDFKATGLEVAEAREGSVGEMLEAPGEIQAAQNRIAQITPPVPGIVRAVHKITGDHVPAGGPLCTIESAELGSARAELLAALAERDVTERNYARWKQLYENGLRSQTELWTAEADSNKAKLRAQAAVARLNALGISATDQRTPEASSVGNRYELRAPIAGVVLKQQLTVGQNVEQKDTLYTVADLSNIWVIASLYEQDLPRVRKGAAATVTVQIQTSNSLGSVLDGTVDNVGQQADPQTRTVPVRILVKNRPDSAQKQTYLLRPGMFATVHIVTSHKSEAVVIPSEAIQEINGQSVVFVEVPVVASDPDTDEASKKDMKDKVSFAFEARPVDLGISDAKVTQITKGLRPGEKVVVRNAFLLRSELQKSKIADED